MKKILIILLVLLTALLLTSVVAQAGPPVKEEAGDQCTTIQSGELLASDGEVITTGYDEWGYNYQAHMFNGLFCKYDRNATDCQPDAHDELMMKWNDAWLSNVDCDGDSLLDRHYPSSSYVGSGAWLTNHQKGTYESDGQSCNWESFVKIVAAPAGATLDGGVWYNADGTEIGAEIWGDFAIIQEVSNDACAGDHGLQYVSPDHPGLGNW